jgi:20S proteasome subunit alpha 7
VHTSRQIAGDFRKNYRKAIPTKVPQWIELIKILSEQLGSFVAQHTLYAFYRPFGVTSIVAGVDEDGPQLYMIEPSGLYWVCSLYDTDIGVFWCCSG